MSVIIHSTSGSGKSVFCKYAYGPRGIPIVDGDNVIAAAGAWPKQEQWWKDPAIASAAHELHARLIVELCERNRDVVVCFNTHTATLASAVKAARASIEQAAIVLPRAQLLARAAERNRLAAISKEAAGGHSVRTLDSYLAGWERQRDAYVENGIRIFSSFAVAAKHFGWYVKKEYYSLPQPDFKATPARSASKSEEVRHG